MDKVDLLYSLFRNKIPFSFIKLNDGECLAMNDINAVISRGDDKSSEIMSQKLKESLNYEAVNYFVGLPCQCCQNNHYQTSLQYLSNKDSLHYNVNKYLNANILINSNTWRTYDELKKNCINRRIVIISNDENLINIRKLEEFNIKPYRLISVSSKNAFENDYSRVKDEVKYFQDGDVVICLCGPLGRVLCYEWFKYNKNLTCLELGSLFDPYLKNRSYAYHTLNHPMCWNCFPDFEISDEVQEKIKNLIKNPEIQNECFYSYGQDTKEHYYGMFGNNKRRILNNCLIRHKKEPHNQFIKDFIYELEKIPEKHPLHEYLHLNKNQLFKEIEKYYYNRDNAKLEKLCEYYLDLFEEVDDHDTRMTLFFYGVSLMWRNNEKSCLVFENLLRKKELQNHIKNWTEYNVSLMYTKNGSDIPKVIHLIYLKEKDLENFNFRCIKSIAQYCKDYKIKIHNDIEPINNIYWNEIKKIPNIEIIKTQRIKSFDGFPINHVQYEADILRMEIMYNEGGIYMDTDILVVRNFDEIFNSGKAFYLSTESAHDTNLINSFLAAKPHNEFIKIWLDKFRSGLRMDNWGYHIRDSNKQILEKNPHYMLKYQIEIMDGYYFFPFKWAQRDIYNGEKENGFIKLPEKTYGVHLFDTIWREQLKQNKFLKSYYDIDFSNHEFKELNIIPSFPIQENNQENITMEVINLS